MSRRTPEAVYDLIARLTAKGVLLDLKRDDAGVPVKIVATDRHGRLDDADVAELRRHKRHVLDALELIDCLDLATPPRPPATAGDVNTRTPPRGIDRPTKEVGCGTPLFGFDDPTAHPRRTP